MNGFNLARRLKWLKVYLDNRMITVRQSMKSIYEQLSGDFVYVNKSCIVNRYKIRELDKKERFLYLAGGFRVEVAFRELSGIAKLMKRTVYAVIF